MSTTPAQASTSVGGVLRISGADWEQGGVKGVEILSVSGSSSAEIAGLHEGDVITDLNGKKVRSTQDLLNTLAQMKPGSRVTIGYITKTQLRWMPKETAVTLAKVN